METPPPDAPASTTPASDSLTLHVRESRIHSVSFKSQGDTETVVVTFTTGKGKSLREVTVTGTRPPHAELRETQKALSDILLRLTEQPKTANVLCTKVAFKWDDDGANFGAVLSGKRTLVQSRGALALNSPLRWQESEDERQQFSPDDYQTLLALMEDARVYLALPDPQGDLFGQPVESGDGAAGATVVAE